jgi:GNAT superfamily N-acetyltransferase
MIDEKWWNLTNVSSEDIDNEADSHWKWDWIAGEYSSGSVKECVAILSKDNYIEGALAYQFSAKSALEPSEGTVYVGWLATAPRNRGWLVDAPIYRGIGTGLLYWAVRESYNAGLGGRISLESLPTPSTISFYEHKGFVRTDLSQPADNLVEYELPVSAAQAWLQEEGDIQR